MTTYYWVGTGTTGTKNWNNSSYWSTYPGGPGGSGPPNSAFDDAVFDSSSPADRVRLNAATATVINNFTSTTWTGTFYNDWTSFNSFDVKGNITTDSGVTWESGGTGTTTRTICLLVMSGGGTQNITTNGANFNAYLTVTSGNTYLQDNWNSTATTNLNNGTTLLVQGGYFSANNYNVSLTRMNATSGSLVLGSGTWTLRGSSTVSNIFIATNLATYTPSTSTVIFTGQNANISVSGTANPSSYIFYNLSFASASSSGTYKILSANQANLNYNSFSVTTPAPYTLIFGSDKTNNYTHKFNSSFSVNGTSSNKVSLQSSDNSYMYMNNNSGALQTITYANVSNFYGSGGSWAADYCNNLGSNVNITFTNSVGGSFMPLLVT